MNASYPGHAALGYEAMPRYRKVRVETCEKGIIVCFQGDWGVLEGNHLDRWIGGPIRLRNDDMVEILERPKSKQRKKDG